MYCLSKKSRCQERYCEEAEARRVLGKRESDNHGEGMEKVDDDKLPYCRAALTNRVNTNASSYCSRLTTRVINKELILDTDDEGGTATLLKGTRVFINPALIHF